jgi:predicted nucleotidyltransferase
MVNLITSNIEKIRQLLASNRIVEAYVFGSAVKGDFNENSDVDFLVRFSNDLTPLEKGELWWNLHDELRKFLKREIDIVTINSLKNPYFVKEIDSTKVLIYGE